MLLVTGSQDRAVPVSNTERLQRTLGCPLVLLDGLGHVAHEEDPAGFAKLVADYVRHGVLPAASTRAAPPPE